MTFRFTRILMLGAACGAAFAASSQTSLSPGAMALLEKYRNAPESRSQVSTVNSLIEISDPAALDSLRAKGIEVQTSFGSFAVITLPLDRFESVSRTPGIKSMEFGTTATPNLDRARAATDVDNIHNGKALAAPYTGKGVIVGIIDTGLDPLHPSFLDAQGSPRVKKFIVAAGEGSVREGFTAADFRRMQTDNKQETHGTHVTGIAAGSRGLRADMPVISEPDADGRVTVSAIREGDLPYYGVAPEADIVMAGGSLQIADVVLMAKNIIDYAEEVGKPAVINMSLGLGVGPHNGTSTFSRAVAELGKEALFSISAGNEGDANVSIDHTVTGGKPLCTALYLTTANASSPSKQHVEIHAPAGTDMKVYIAGFNKLTGEEVFSVRVQNFTADGDFRQFSLAQLNKYSTYFGGKPTAGIGDCADDGTRMAYISFDGVYPLPTNANVVLGLKVQAPDGTRVLAFANNSTHPFYNAGLSSLNPGSPDFSISDMATGENIITVGAFNTRDQWAALDKNFYGFRNASFPYLEQSDYSSYGVLLDGNSRPHVSAPGTTIISSLNRYYTSGQGKGDNESCAAVIRTSDIGGFDTYYDQMLGTSMAAPFVTGTLALWLEANPALTVGEALDIIAKTSVKDDNYNKGNNAVRQGAGRINPVAGLKEVLARLSGSGIGGVSTDIADSGAIITADGSVASAFFAGAASVTIDVFSPAGIRVASATSAGAEASVSTASLTPGIYVVRACADGRGIATRKIKL